MHVVRIILSGTIWIQLFRIVLTDIIWIYIALIFLTDQLHSHLFYYDRNCMESHLCLTLRENTMESHRVHSSGRILWKTMKHKQVTLIYKFNAGP